MLRKGRTVVTGVTDEVWGGHGNIPEMLILGMDKDGNLCSAWRFHQGIDTKAAPRCGQGRAGLSPSESSPRPFVVPRTGTKLLS